MIKKFFLLIFIVSGLIILTGCQKKQTPSSNQNQNHKDNLSQPANNENRTNHSNDQKSDSNSLADNIKNLFQSGQKIKCTYHDSEINSKVITTAYINTSNNTYRMEFVDDQGNKNITVFDGQTLYSWAVGSKMGTKMNQNCIKELQANPNPEPDSEETNKNDNEPINIKEKLFLSQDVKCEPINGIDFSLPQNVQFIDQCEMLKKQQETLKGIQENMKNIPGMPNNMESK